MKKGDKRNVSKFIPDPKERRLHREAIENEPEFMSMAEREPDFTAISKEVTSEKYYIEKILPYSERKLSEIAERLDGGGEPEHKLLLNAMINRASGQTALWRYPDSPTVREFAERIGDLYSRIAKHYGDSAPK